MTEVSFEDIKQFILLKEPEGPRVDYKEDFPENKNLAKTVASFANTEGGIILLGVTTDGQNRPKEIVGIPSGGGLSDRITNVTSARIRPRLVPEVRVVDLEGRSGSVLLIIRVQSGLEAPYYLPDYDGEPLIPVRVGSRSIRADLATIEALLRRRSGDVAARKRREAGRVNLQVFEEYRRSTGEDVAEADAFVLRIKIFALGGPERLCIFTRELDDFLLANLPYESPLGGGMRITRDGKLEADRGFRSRPAQDSVRLESVGKDGRGRPLSLLVAVTEMGAVSFAALILRPDFHPVAISQYFRDTLLFCHRFLDKVGYSGEIGVDFFLENIGEVEYQRPRLVKFKGPQHVHVYESFSCDTLREAPAQILKFVTRRWLREGSLPVPEDELEELVRSLFPG